MTNIDDLLPTMDEIVEEIPEILITEAPEDAAYESSVIPEEELGRQLGHIFDKDLESAEEEEAYGETLAALGVRRRKA